jgi:hypothetical protein
MVYLVRAPICNSSERSSHASFSLAACRRTPFSLISLSLDAHSPLFAANRPGFLPLEPPTPKWSSANVRRVHLLAVLTSAVRLNLHSHTLKHIRRAEAFGWLVFRLRAHYLHAKHNRGHRAHGFTRKLEAKCDFMH